MNSQKAIRLKLRFFVACVCTLGIACMGFGMVPWRHTDVIQFACYLVLSAVAAGWKVEFPGFNGTLSVSLVLFIVSICNMSLSETLALGITAVAIQYCWRAKRFSAVQILFNVSQIAIALTAAYETYSSLTRGVLHGRPLIALVAATTVYFVLNSVPVAIAVSLAERGSTRNTWRECAWTFPYYLVEAAIGAMMVLLNRYAGWELAVLVMPAVYIMYRSYSLYIGRLEDTKTHLEEMASVHLRTVEALALAIDAKDHTTGDHVNRVRIYALELAKDLGATAAEMDALRAAAVLHDIGKLAVPEHIISKPGKLTPEEFDKMKVHPIVGAEILEQVDFPYPVVPIVRSHHEKWDGGGYPDGLAGEAIPLGARILSVVDCLDALASDRQYRRALPLDEAMARIEQEAGKTFDPRVVAALKARYVELERFAKSQQTAAKPKLSVDVKVTRGGAPGAGYAEPAKHNAVSVGMPAMLQTPAIAPAAVAGEDMLPSLVLRLRHEIPFDAIALFAVKDSRITARFAFGQESGTLLRFQAGANEGLLGWLLTARQPIVNGNPTVDADGPKTLKSALAIPIEHAGSIAGLAVLYHRSADAFSTRHLDALKRCSEEFRAALNLESASATVNECVVASATASATAAAMAAR
jgi:putative nucleotidyltransferase with HDIG domain